MNSELDRIFEQGLSEVTRSPKAPLSDERIAAAAAATTSGVGIWLLAHAREILLCAVSLAVGVGGTLLVMHLLDSRNTVPAETAAAIATDTASTTGTTMVAEDTATFSGEPTVDTVETQCIASLQTNPKTASVETRRAASLQTEQNTVSAKPASKVSRPKSHVSHSTSPVSTPVVVKKTVVQRDTVVINETVTLKDTVYVP